MTPASPDGHQTPGTHLARRLTGEPRRHLIIPVMPTPNGRLHLGHVAGPFLKCDVLARHLRRAGHEVWIISGSDAYESYVLLKSGQTGETPAEIARMNHHLIDQDLHSLDIVYDEWISPLHPQWKDLHDGMQLDVLRHFTETGKAVRRLEKVPYDPKDNRFIMGCWLLGRCPVCGANAGGYCCENCGAHFSPEEIQSPRSRGGGATSEVEVESLFLKLSDPEKIREIVSRMHLPDAFTRAADVYLQHKTDVRLTNPGRWGVAWPVAAGDLPHVVYSHTGLFSYSLTCGSVYQQLTSDPVHPFHPDSNVVTIATFGLDNASFYLIGVLGSALEHTAYRPFDHYLGNYFLNLENHKFSTSRNHVIWASDLVGRTSISSDLARMFLARISPEEWVSNLDIDELVSFVNEDFGASLQATLAAASRQIECEVEPTSPPPALMDAFVEALKAQIAALSPNNFSLRRAVRAIEDWLASGMSYCDTPARAYWWLKSFALLVHPLMPRLGEDLWQKLGHADQPTMAKFFDETEPLRRPLNYRHTPTSREEILTATALQKED
ncbi:class I tRNA ligase family protein [Bradyrhizobium prioriisuperbiae]|uniref:class I tRNA ligase family protein n=1 Tax=Bradyrhizobium prioriisuperbiae TaxID=2854389 RepID=UPI0028EEA27B|nr:class I tRNA ligase family protein [Bradyrhizobium prioritasuperba]